MLASCHLPLAPLPGGRPWSADELCRATRSGVALCAGALDRVLRHDAERGLIEVQSGVPWGALSGIPGAALLPGTVGESMAANSPGPDGRPMVAHLHAFTLATADGELRRASRERAADLFALAAGGFGAFGPFYSLTLDLGSLAAAHAGRVAPVRVEAAPEGEGPSHGVELLVPPEARDAVIAQVRAALEERRCALALLEGRRVVPETDTYLRWARREYVLLRIEYRVRPTLGASVAAEQLRARLVGAAIGAGGSFTPAELPRATRTQAEACYPMLGSFLAEKRRLDAAERIAPPWYRHARRVWRGEACSVRWARD